MSAGERPLVVGLGGTNRAGSTSEKALRLALERAESRGCHTALLCGAMLELPAYDPGLAHRGPAARRLVETLRAAAGVILATPSYHGGYSGLIKNALDYTEDMRADPAPYFEGRAVGMIVTAYGAQGLGTTMTALRAVAHALRGWPTPYGATINSAAAPFPDGAPTDETAAQIALVADQVAEFAWMRQSCRALSP